MAIDRVGSSRGQRWAVRLRPDPAPIGQAAAMPRGGPGRGHGIAQPMGSVMPHRTSIARLRAHPRAYCQRRMGWHDRRPMWASTPSSGRPPPGISPIACGGASGLCTRSGSCGIGQRPRLFLPQSWAERAIEMSNGRSVSRLPIRWARAAARESSMA